RALERRADARFGPGTRVDRRLEGDFVQARGMQGAADLRVLSFGVLAHDNEIDVARLSSGERRAYARIENRGPHAGVLIESAADGQEKPVQRDIVLNPRIADRAEENGVEGTQAIERIRR